MSVEIPVNAPADFTMAFLHDHFVERAAAEGNAAATLDLALRAPGLGGLTLEKAVDADVRYVAGRGAPTTLAIAWRPRNSGAFPRFRGTLTATADGAERCRLSLAGSYVPPGGIAGRAFNALVGQRIARATLDDLLRGLAKAAEADYRLRVAL